MKHPDIGMTYKDVSKRLKRIQKTEKAGKVKNPQLKHNIVNSLRHQLKLREGTEAVKEADREATVWGHPIGKGFRGFGKGKKGTYGGFEMVSPGRYRKTYN
jgi:hypothetical protein